jgi:hypothetical protein
MVDAMQWQIVIPGFCVPVWRWFLDAAFTAGLIPTADVPAEWAPPSLESVNPLQDAQTALLETRAGVATLPSRSANAAMSRERCWQNTPSSWRSPTALGWCSTPTRAEPARWG